jgi:hypothetical protein
MPSSHTPSGFDLIALNLHPLVKDRSGEFTELSDLGSRNAERNRGFSRVVGLLRKGRLGEVGGLEKQQRAAALHIGALPIGEDA